MSRRGQSHISFHSEGEGNPSCWMLLIPPSPHTASPPTPGQDRVSHVCLSFLRAPLPAPLAKESLEPLSYQACRALHHGPMLLLRWAGTSSCARRKGKRCREGQLPQLGFSDVQRTVMEWPWLWPKPIVPALSCAWCRLCGAQPLWKPMRNLIKGLWTRPQWSSCGFRNLNSML